MKRIKYLIILALLIPSLSYGATVTKSYIGEQDVKKYDGTGSDTFSRVTSTGGTVVLNKAGYEVDALISYGNGSNRTDATISAAMTAIGTTNKVTLVLRPGTWVISSNADWSSYTNVTFKFADGAVLSHGAFTINIPYIEANRTQIFSGTGTITISGGQSAYFEWWGASPGASAAINSVALQNALNSTAPLILSKASFTYDTALTLVGGASPTVGTSIVGEHKTGSRLIYTGVGNGLTGGTTRKDNMRLENFRLTASSTSNAGNGIALGGGLFYSTIKNLFIDGFGNAGIYVLGGLHSNITKNYIAGRTLANGGAGYGIYIGPHGTYGLETTLIVDHNYISGIETAGGTGTGIAWTDSYKCTDTDNIIEFCDRGHNIQGISTSGFFGLVRPYYESVTTELIWHDQGGYALGGTNPNTVATWSAVTGGAAMVRYMQRYGWSGLTANETIGTLEVMGSVYLDKSVALSVLDSGDTGPTLTEAHSIVSAAPTSTGRAVTLPTAIGISGRVYVVQKRNSAQSTIITPFGAQTISSAATYTLHNLGEYLVIVSDGANWQVIGSGGIKQAAIANTTATFTGADTVSKSEIVALQTEVNLLKAALREFGVIKN